MIEVCPLSKLEETINRVCPSHVLSLVSPGTDVRLPSGFEAAHHLILEFNDIAEERDGLIAPSAEHVEAILEFSKHAALEETLLVHCWAGVSRSTAAAYIITCAVAPELDERDLALQLRTLSPVATPNPLLVMLADKHLRREGRMIKAIKGIGRGAETFEGNAFSLDLNEYTQSA